MKSRTIQRPWACLLLLAIAAYGSAYAQTAAGQGPQSSPSIEQDLLTRLKGQPIGQGTLDSADVPDEFLRRVADRIIRMDYQKRYRMVLRGDAGSVGGAGNSTTTGPASTLPVQKPPATSWPLFGIAGSAGLILVIARTLRRRKRKGLG